VSTTERDRERDTAEPRAAAGVPRLFLASRSPRRRQFLSDAGLAHDAEHPGLEDSELTPGDVTPKQWVASLAYLKAAAGAQVARHATAAERRWVLGADTACIAEGALIGSPTNAAEARRMLQSFRDGEHEVVTGVALVELDPAVDDDLVPRRRSLFATSARVKWGSVSDQQIEDYLASGGWAGKAGGYNLRERVAAGWAITCEGDPTCVMGLPMEALLRKLAILRHRWLPEHSEAKPEPSGQLQSRTAAVSP
jgi:septum formation protein